MDRNPSGIVAPIAVMAVIVAIIGACVAIVGHPNAKPHSNAALLRLVHSASNALDSEPSNTFTMTMTISAGGTTEMLSMSGASSPRNNESSITMSGAGLHEEAIAINGVSYIENPLFTQNLSDGKHWLAVRTLKPTAIQKDLASSGPDGVLKGLAAAGGTVEDEGTQDVHGVETTEYLVHYDALGVFGSTFNAIFGSRANAILKQAGFDNLPMELWLDANGVPRKTELDIHFRGLSEHEVEYMTPSDKELHLAAPPSSDVHMLGSLEAFGAIVRHSIAAAT